MKKIYSTGEVATMLGVPRHRIEYAIANGHLPEARFRFLDKRCFTRGDIRKVADYFGAGETQKGGQQCSDSST